MSRIGICLLTYARTDYALETLNSLFSNLAFTGDEWFVHIADDGSPDTHRDELWRAAQNYVARDRLTMTNSERGGYGKSVNLAMQVLHGKVDYALMLEDDWRLTRELDVKPLIAAMEASIGVECIRLGYLSFTQALHGRVMSAPPEWFKYLLLDPASDEPHVFAGHPRLESVAYQKRVGSWPEGLPPGPTEFAVAHMPEARRGVAWPMDLIHPTIDPLFAHIGGVRSIDVKVEDGAAQTV